MYLCHISNFHRNINRKTQKRWTNDLIAFSNPARFPDRKYAGSPTSCQAAEHHPLYG